MQHLPSDCMKCKHNFDDVPGAFCRAFPNKDGIPDSIYQGDIKHTKPYPGQVGNFVFELKSDKQ